MTAADVSAAPSDYGLPLARCLDAFRRWLHMPSPDALLAVLATVAANRMPGDPIWLLVVGPPSGGKTELLYPLAGLPDVWRAATLTEASLLSGTPKRDSKGAKGGLLREIGDFGLIVLKDFGSVLSMNRDARAATLAALREVYDGSWTRHVGSDGGRTLDWQGKVGLIAACTPAIDSHHAVIGSMGERFAQYRLPPVDAGEQARRALKHAREATAMRRDLTRAVVELFEAIDWLAPQGTCTAEEECRLIALAELGVRCRSAVERDPHSREVELIPEPEAPGRLALVLSQLLDALTLIGASRENAWRIVAKIALDSMPAIRRAVLDCLTSYRGSITTSRVADELNYPNTTARRALQDLTAHGVVERERQGDGQADLWALSAWTKERWQAVGTVPEVSGVAQSTHGAASLSLPLRNDDNKSGTVPGFIESEVF